MASRWIGDLSTCFLLEDGWAYRLKVNRFQLKGRSGWQMPVSVADALALAPGEALELPCATASIEHTLWLERRADACVGSEIDVPLRRLGCHEEDLAFLVFRHDCYRVVVRHRQELDAEDALGSLMWHCGLDPSDEALRADPWPRIVRAMGGTGASPEVVAERLRQRGDKRLMVLLEDAAAERRRAVSSSRWSPLWQYVLPDLDEEEYFILQRGDGHVRVALGVLDGTAQQPRDLMLGDGGTIWATLAPSDELGGAQQLLEAPPPGLVPSARRSSWVRWMRAEHAGRRAALLGRAWSLEPSDDGWKASSRVFVNLVEALLDLREESSHTAAEPGDRVRTAYPRNGIAFATLVDGAIEKGLRRLEGAVGLGYRAVFSDGVVEAVSLTDALQ